MNIVKVTFLFLIGIAMMFCTTSKSVVSQNADLSKCEHASIINNDTYHIQVRKEKTNKDIIGQWLLTIEEENHFPEGIIALNFGLYEPYGTMDLIGSMSYDAQDDDWACNEDWVPIHRICPRLTIPEDKEWDEVLVEMKRLIEELIQDYPTLKLWEIPHITIGFADGDLVVIDNASKRK